MTDEDINAAIDFLMDEEGKPTEPPAEPELTLEEQIGSGITAQSRRDSGEWDEYGDQKFHKTKVEFQESRVVLSFYCGGGSRGRFVQVNIDPDGITGLVEWDQRRQVRQRRTATVAQRGRIARAVRALADNSQAAKSLLEDYDRLLGETSDE